MVFSIIHDVWCIHVFRFAQYVNTQLKFSCIHVDCCCFLKHLCTSPHAVCGHGCTICSPHDTRLPNGNYAFPLGIWVKTSHPIMCMGKWGFSSTSKFVLFGLVVDRIVTTSQRTHSSAKANVIQHVLLFVVANMIRTTKRHLQTPQLLWVTRVTVFKRPCRWPRSICVTHTQCFNQTSRLLSNVTWAIPRPQKRTTVGNISHV